MNSTYNQQFWIVNIKNYFILSNLYTDKMKYKCKDKKYSTTLLENLATGDQVNENRLVYF